tara:strand:- start:1185 stop:1745 length:561 start_codon:yes stop_codon:yes gene_type:complete
MSLKRIIIYQNKILFNILNELYSDKFSFHLVDEKNFNDMNIVKEKSDLIIVSQNNSNFKNQLILKNFPLNIKKILELININLLKNNFRLQSQIKIGSYNLNLNSKEISLDNKKLFLTERESNLILFLKNSDDPININQLQKKVWGHISDLETHTVETHIYRLRKKIKEKFDDSKFIISTQNGYTIN